MSLFLERKIYGRGRQLLGIASLDTITAEVAGDYAQSTYQFMHAKVGNLLVAHSTTDPAAIYKTKTEIARESGPGAPVLRAIARYGRQRDAYRGGLVVTGIQTAGEAAVIKQQGGQVVFVDIPAHRRTLEPYDIVGSVGAADQSGPAGLLDVRRGADNVIADIGELAEFFHALTEQIEPIAS